MKPIKLKEIDNYTFEKNVLEGLEFLKTFLTGGNKGEKGDKIFILEQSYNTKKSEEISWEGHRKYIDIQYMLSGNEEMDVRNINLMKASTQYDEVNDFQFFNEIEENNSNPIKVNEDEFLVFFPKDIHKPCIGNGNKVKKIVVKVKL